MSDYRERSCRHCGSLLHHEDRCRRREQEEQEEQDRAALPTLPTSPDHRCLVCGSLGHRARNCHSKPQWGEVKVSICDTPTEEVQDLEIRTDAQSSLQGTFNNYPDTHKPLGLADVAAALTKVNAVAALSTPWRNVGKSHRLPYKVLDGGEVHSYLDPISHTLWVSAYLWDKLLVLPTKAHK